MFIKIAKFGRRILSAGKILIISAFLMTIFVLDAFAQQTIFNVPSPDVLEKGKIYFELDATFKTNDQETLRRFSSFVPRVVAGIGGAAEVGLNLTGNVQPGRDATTLVAAIKWRVYDNEKNGVQIIVGDSVFVPLRNKSYNVGNYAYAQISKTFRSKTRVTGGAYYFTKNVVSSAARVGGQFSFEQPITGKLNIAADYYTGRNAAGYFTPGINFKPHRKLTGYLGYSLGNADLNKGNHYFYAALGVNLN